LNTASDVSSSVAIARVPSTSTTTLRVLAEKAVVAPTWSGFMSTSESVVILEVAAAVLLIGGAIALACGGDLSVPGADVHPLWIPVLVFAARYGVRGMFTAIAMSAIALGISALALHGTLDAVAVRGQNPYDLIALMAATLVAWTAMMRDRRITRAAEEQGDISKRLASSEETADALREAVGVLRQRLDRIDLSVSMWRAIARRLDHGSLNEAATAALELASIRSGAASGEVHQNFGGRLYTVATFGHGALIGGEPMRDHTVIQAIARRRPALRRDTPGARKDDPDVVIPIIDPDTRIVLGVLALRDAPAGRLRLAEIRDLELVASWLAPAFLRGEEEASLEAAC
jgi:hypothetical protein